MAPPTPEWGLTEDGRIYRAGNKEYPNGDKYTGEFVDGLREGQGVLKYASGNTYQGFFKANQFHGVGTMKYAPLVEDGVVITGRTYKGEWVKGLKQGQGTLSTGTGEVYEGSFMHDMFSGDGILKGAGKVLNGEWRRGRLHGKAKCTYPHGVQYVGEMEGGEYHGKGRLVLGKKGGWYEGDFKFGKQQDGVGTRRYMNGNLYEGSFREGEPDKEGAMRYANGDVYVGEWVMGQCEGKGILSMANGDRYEGDFLRGKFFGRGRYMWSDGGHYDGEYLAKAPGIGHNVQFPRVNGLRHGIGKRVWASGATYEGSWEDDRMEGKGVYVCPEGSRYEGEFRASHKEGGGRCQWGNQHNKPFKCPMGSLHRGQGYCVYEGGWKREGHWDGEGKFRCVDGRRAEGTWREGLLHGWGTSLLMLESERGDPRRMHIGGIGGLYRVYRYSGQWVEGQRQGLGVAEYANGDRLIGVFVRTHIHGYGLYVFGDSLKIRQEAGHWVMGQRERWVPLEEAGSSSNMLSAAIAMMEADSGALIPG
ncbi:unnamed protein product, partial [Discosporangium mesarthrocarpum]